MHIEDARHGTHMEGVDVQPKPYPCSGSRHVQLHYRQRQRHVDSVVASLTHLLHGRPSERSPQSSCQI